MDKNALYHRKREHKRWWTKHFPDESGELQRKACKGGGDDF